MKKYLVIGNPIEHSLSPKLHNHWFKQNNINALYEKKKLNEDNIKEMISEIKNEKIDGINVTIPFKKKVISFLDELSFEANQTQSVNTICREKNNPYHILIFAPQNQSSVSIKKSWKKISIFSEIGA